MSEAVSYDFCHPAFQRSDTAHVNEAGKQNQYGLRPDEFYYPEQDGVTEPYDPSVHEQPYSRMPARSEVMGELAAHQETEVIPLRPREFITHEGIRSRLHDTTKDPFRRKVSLIRYAHDAQGEAGHFEALPEAIEEVATEGELETTLCRHKEMIEKVMRDKFEMKYLLEDTHKFEHTSEWLANAQRILRMTGNLSTEARFAEVAVRLILSGEITLQTAKRR